MRWDRFFDDLEDQVASEWEAERAALDTEAERLRLSRLTLDERITALASGGHETAVDLIGGTVLRAPVAGAGADWLLLAPLGSGAGAALVPTAAIVSLGLPHAELLRSARKDVPVASSLARRATFGFAVRDLVRRRIGVTVHVVSGAALAGTIDRAGADHLDLALHDVGAVRRASDVSGFRVVPFTAIGWIAIHEASPG